MIKELIKLATHLDSKGLSKEADYLDSIIKKEAQEKPAPTVMILGSAAVMMGANVISIRVVEVTTGTITVSKSFRGKEDKIINEAKDYIAELKVKHPNAEIKIDVSPPLTIEMLGL